MKNFLTFRQLDTALLHKGDLNENDVIPDLRVVIINDKLMRVYRLLDGLNDPWYHKSTPLAATADVEILTDSVISSYTASTNTIVRSTLTWTLGQLLCISIFSTGGAHIADFVGRVVSGQGTNTAVLEIICGTDADMGANKITVISPKGCTAQALDLSGLYVKDILKIYDNAYIGGKIRIFTPIKDPAIFARLHRDPFFDTSICYFQLGDSVKLYVGTAATALATIQFEYRGKPALCAGFDTDAYIDVPPEDNQMLMDEVLVEYLMVAKKPIPPELEVRHAEFQKRYEAAAADAQKTLTDVKGKRS